MFTIDNLRAAAAVTVTAAILTVPAFSAPKRDVGNGKNQRAETFEVRLIHPSNPPAGSGHNDVTVGAMRNRGTSIDPEPASATEVHLVTPSPFPSGAGPNDITVGAMRKKDNDNSRKSDGTTQVRLVAPSPFPSGHGSNDVTVGAMRKKDNDSSKKSDGTTQVRLVAPSPFPSGSGSNDITVGAMTSTASAPAAASATRSASTSFIRSMDLSSGGRWTGGSAAPIVTRNAFTDGRAWVSLTKDADNGITAAAGVSFLLK